MVEIPAPPGGTEPMEFQGGNIRVLFVTDDESIPRFVKDYMGRPDITIDSCRMDEAPDRFDDHDILVTDRWAGYMDGDDMPGDKLITELKARKPGLKVIITSEIPDPVGEPEARGMGAENFRKNVAPHVDRYLMGDYNLQDIGKAIQELKPVRNTT